MTHKINISLFEPGSFRNAIQEIQRYEKWIRERSNELVERVSELIRERAEWSFLTAIADDFINEEAPVGGVTVTVDSQGDGVILVVAKGKQAVFMEFGAGVYHNGAVGNSPHPLGAQLGYTIGSYGLGLGARETWGFTDEYGEFHLTHGVPASMPLYNAMMATMNEIERIAMEVFSHD